MVSVCEVQDMKLVKNIKNSKYITFPYIMYKVNDLLPITPEVLIVYDELLYKDSYVEYLVFEYKFDVKYVDPGVFGDCEALTFEQVKSSLSTDQQYVVSKLKLNNPIFIRNL